MGKRVWLFIHVQVCPVDVLMLLYDCRMAVLINVIVIFDNITFQYRYLFIFSSLYGGFFLPKFMILRNVNFHAYINYRPIL